MRMCTVLACLAALLFSMLLKDGLKIFRWPRFDCQRQSSADVRAAIPAVSQFYFRS